MGKKSFSIEKINLVSKKEKPRPIIAKFLSFPIRNEFLFCKSKLKTSEKFLNIYITKDLAQLCHKLLNYVKTKFGYKFVMYLSYNRKITMKIGLLGRYQKT